MNLKRVVGITSAIAGAMLVMHGLIVFAPKTDKPREVDVIVVLAPFTHRLDDAVDLIDAGYSDTLALSNPSGEYTQWACADGAVETDRRVEVVCFTPEPETTEGEALAFAEAAEEYGWETATVVTDRTHLSRTRMYFETRAPNVETSFVLADRERTPGGWLGAYAYEFGAWVKAAVTPRS